MGDEEQIFGTDWSLKTEEATAGYEDLKDVGTRQIKLKMKTCHIGRILQKKIGTRSPAVSAGVIWSGRYGILGFNVPLDTV